MAYTKLEQLSKNLKSNFFYNYDVSTSTWFQAGGKTDVFCLVSDEKELEIILNHTEKKLLSLIPCGSYVMLTKWINFY